MVQMIFLWKKWVILRFQPLIFRGVEMDVCCRKLMWTMEDVSYFQLWKYVYNLYSLPSMKKHVSIATHVLKKPMQLEFSSQRKHTLHLVTTKPRRLPVGSNPINLGWSRLVLSCGTDSMLCLWRISSVASAPLGAKGQVGGLEGRLEPGPVDRRWIIYREWFMIVYINIYINIMYDWDSITVMSYIYNDVRMLLMGWGTFSWRKT